MRLSPASAATVETAPAMETSSEAPAVEAPKAGLSPESAGSRKPAMIEPAERAGTHAARAEVAAAKMSNGQSPLRRRMKVTAIDDRPLCEIYALWLIEDPSAAVPIVSPVVPTPAEAGK